MDEIVRSLSLIAAVLGFFVAVLLLMTPGRDAGNRHLGAFVGLFAFISLMRYLLHWDVSWVVFGALILVPGLFFLGPLLYFYTRQVLFKTRIDLREYWRHAPPAIAALILHTGLHVLFWDELSVSAIRTRSEVSVFFLPAVVLSVYVSLVTYALFSLRVLHRYVRSIEENFAHDYREQIAWLRLFLIFQLIIAAIHIPVVIFSFFVSVPFPVHIVDALIFAGFIFLVCYNLIKRPAIFRINEPRDVATTVETSPENKKGNDQNRYRKQSLDGDTRRALLERIQDLMEDEQPFLEENISLQEVAARLNVPPHHVSMVINAELGLNFYSFINRYRLEEVTRMLSDPDLAEENVLNIAFRAGFQSKAAFNRVFKQHTRLSPREFRARALD